jgi:hypothetical protein
MTVPDLGDILMLSQASRKIGRAFSAGQQSVPHEFQEVEAEATGLAMALRQLADALHAEGDQGLVREAADHVKHGIEIIWNSCKRTVLNLDNLVDHNQVIKKHRTVGGFAIERSWSDVVLADYSTMIWTTEGGDLYSLKDLLGMHTRSITILVQAVQRLVNSTTILLPD